MKKQFTIPHMTVCREDIEISILNIDAENETKKVCKLTDEEMQQIANKLSNNLMQDWDVCLKEAYKTVTE